MLAPHLADELLYLELRTRVEAAKRRYGVQTLEEAFFAATGREYVEDEGDENDDYREVYA